MDIVHWLAVPRLQPHIGTLLLSYVSWTAIQYGLAPALCRKIVGKDEWEKLNGRAKNGWTTHVVSMFHSLLVVPIAFRSLDVPALDHDRAFGWDDSVAKLYAISSGYFVWDSVESLIHYEDIGFTVHALACLGIYLFSFRPFLAYYGARFLLWEISTPFLNIHWFIDKTGNTGSLAQMINGVFLLGTFAGTRLVYGGIMSYRFFHTLRAIHHQIPFFIALFYGVGNVVLQFLNWFWFTKMIAALQKRFAGSSKPKESTGPQVKSNQTADCVAVANGDQVKRSAKSSRKSQ
ncbi:DUF887-domain-containing protein [Stereum hirsutum FP-91666 SS1]|uniref:DUF887-domain-containing protein n=1 Tax=Stereum hirsutum (strain FP-91666) TaxID=721885 RepID=UPI000440B6BC|nr:DUF887-domain-containing protein [Stereum hirsutum FP-91666 SS1]EIM89588.1 DUF887-domain-containing protein [Stereum hirsutum FP-91666 SS1]